MDAAGKSWHFPDMPSLASPRDGIPAWNLYGEASAFPDVLHIERITDRAAGLDWVIAPHRHPHLHQFFLIREGRVEIVADGARLHSSPPFLLSVPHGVIHGFAFSAGTDGHVLTVPLQSLPEVLHPAAPLAAGVAVLPADAAHSALFARLHAEHGAALPGRPVLLRALAAEIACLVLRALPPDEGARGAVADPRFVQFQALVQAHLRDRWTVADHARAVGLSARHLSRLCRAATGQPVTALIEAALMREACRLLVYTRTGIAQVGYQLGFDDPAYFSRAFRRVMGLTPGAYRAGFEGDPAGPFRTA
jgi:AraC family transcriptional activator of pobA